MIKKIIRKPIFLIKNTSPKTLLLNRNYERQYDIALSSLTIQRAPECKTAVILHLYYAESWPRIVYSLKNLKNIQYDIFITIPEENSNFSATMLSQYPNAYIVITPNRGRDVLPFLKIAAILKQYGYDHLLKLHSKKSIHRTDGEEWFDSLLNSLIPTDNNTVKKIIKTLERQNTGTIGPAGQYLQLSVNFNANGTHMTELINQMYDRSTSQRVLQYERQQYGFFAGTMFWIRLDAIYPIIENRLMVSNFEVESGQIDATMAHAVERILSLVPEIENKQMYEIDGTQIREIAYNSGVIPDWSNVHKAP